MSAVTVIKDPENLVLTLQADYDVAAERAWGLWQDPRQLERWWGPPMYPATVEEHDLRPGGQVTYFMTGPTGDKPRGLWVVLEVDPPHRLLVDHLFADEFGRPTDAMPATRMKFGIADRPGGVTISIESRFPSLEAMEQLINMGMAQGQQQALEQMAGVLGT